MKAIKEKSFFIVWFFINPPLSQKSVNNYIVFEKLSASIEDLKVASAIGLSNMKQSP
jgi:hypothetical protein